MAKKADTELKPVSQTPAHLSVPEYLKDETELGTDMLGQFIVPPRLKFVQKQSSSELISEFDVGDLIITPQRILVAKIEEVERGKIPDKGDPFFFVPIFFYPEWCIWNPYELKGSLNAIRARSLDPKSEIAIKARDSDLRQAERCPENPPGKEYKLRYVEHLNFVVGIIGVPQLEGIATVLSFSRGSHSSGSNLASLIKMRKAPLYAMVFQGRAQYRSNAQGEWYTAAVENPVAPGPGPWVPEAMIGAYKELHLEFKKAYEEKKLMVDYDDQDNPGTPSDSGEY